MNKKDLIKQVSETTKLSKVDSEKAVEAVFEIISKELSAGNEVKLVNFGNFEVAKRNARKGRNPQSGEEIDIPESKTPKWKASKQLKDKVK